MKLPLIASAIIALAITGPLASQKDETPAVAPVADTAVEGEKKEEGKEAEHKEAEHPAKKPHAKKHGKKHHAKHHGKKNHSKDCPCPDKEAHAEMEVPGKFAESK